MPELSRYSHAVLDMILTFAFQLFSLEETCSTLSFPSRMNDSCLAALDGARFPPFDSVWSLV